MPAYGEDERESLILARSIRKFAGVYSSNPIWVMLPNGQLGQEIEYALQNQDARLLSFEIDSDILEFPFAGKVLAAAAAEELAVGLTATLVWMDSDTIMLNEPDELRLIKGKCLAYRPVMLKLLGSQYDLPIDAFWELVYRYCSTPVNRMFPMRTVVDEVEIRPYFNAGLLSVNPDKGLLRAWKTNFLRLYSLSEFKKFYQEHVLYRIFIHQAILAGTALSWLDPSEFYELSSDYNFAIHLIERLPVASRPGRLNDLVTCRYDAYECLENPAWRNHIRVDDPLLGWLDSQLSQSIDQTSEAC
jgi:hypothetical protein